MQSSHPKNVALPRRELQFPNAQLLPEIVRLMEEGHTVTLRLRGFSMRPFLEDNRDKALLTLAVHPRVGDPVLAEIGEGRYVFHRIVRIEDELVTLCGDGNIGTEQCLLHNVKGAAIGFYRKGRDTLERTDGLKWRLYSWLWMHLLPVRRYLLGAYRRLWLPLFGPM